MSMHDDHGTCTRCGAENEALTIIDDVDRVCDDCLANDYFYCEECCEYWDLEFVEQYKLKDGRVICEHCFEDYDEDDLDTEDE